MPPIGYVVAGVNDCRVFSLSGPLSAFHIVPVTNETQCLLTSSLSSHYIKMFQLFLFVSTNLFRLIVMCEASRFPDVILSLNEPGTAILLQMQLWPVAVAPSIKLPGLLQFQNSLPHLRSSFIRIVYIYYDTVFVIGVSFIRSLFRANNFQNLFIQNFCFCVVCGKRCIIFSIREMI